MKVGLYLMNEKGFSTVKSLVTEFSEYIGFVVSAHDAAVINDFYSDIQNECIKNNVRFYDRKEESQVPAVDYEIAIGWRWLIKKSRHLIVLHDSILPRYRGFTPLVNALINGENEIGVTAIWAAEEYDSGEIIFQEKTEISYPVKIQEAIEMVSVLYQKVCKNIFETIKSNLPLSSVPQAEADATFSIWRDAEDYRIIWSQSAAAIKRFIDAVGFPYEGAQAIVNEDQLIVIDEATVMEDMPLELRHTGKVLKLVNSKPVVICGEGLLRIDSMRYKDGTPFDLKKFRSRFR